MEIKQIKGLSRNTIDKFYTKDTIVKFCLNLFINNININNDDLIIELSAGNGAFIMDIKSLTSNYLFYDLEPEHNEIIKQDYLLLNYNEIIKNDIIHIIGNPSL
jgi:16S rRNA A1518/A1519 N6-dimethyltransferase RsmA/KsgA/DIM1 with predicted DNA glycosylase/AP lyase activity